MAQIQFISCCDPGFADVKAIRTEVFIREQGADSAAEFDRYDSSGDTVYAVLLCDGAAAGTCRLVWDQGYKIGRIAVLKEFRGRGYGAMLVHAVLNKARLAGAGTVKLDAQNYAVPFYEKLGFVITGGEISDRGLPHMPMEIHVSSMKTENQNG